jgi:hypothetical protein
MNQYRVRRQDFPLTLYRVDHPRARTTYSRRWGFRAESTFTPHQINGLQSAVENHLDRDCTIPSPFISTFSDGRHAHNWARDWNKRHYPETCDVVEITIEAGDGVTVFRVADLVGRLGVYTSLKPYQYQDEYLCFLRIPSETIVSMKSK